MRCPNCGAENPSSAKFCKNCGSILGNQRLERRDSQFQSNPGFFARNRKLLIVVVIALLIIGFLILTIIVSLKSAGRKCKDALEMRDAIIENQKQQAPLGNGTGGKSSSSPDERVADRLASFRATASSINAAAMMCADDSTLEISAAGPGADICSDTSSTDVVYPTLKSGVCDGNDYVVMATDTISDDGIYIYEFACYIAGKRVLVICNQYGCDYSDQL